MESSKARAGDPHLLGFIWHLRGSVTLNGFVADEAVLEGVTTLLDKQRKPVLEFGRTSVGFDDPLWNNFVTGWAAMALYDRGRFWIVQESDDRRLRYDLRSLHVMVFCIFCAFTAFFFGLADGGLIGGLKFAAAAFAWLYGMNVLLALIRVPWMIRKCVSSIV